MTRRILFAPEAERQLETLQEYIAREASIEIATRYLDAVLEKIETLADFPDRGTPRDDLRAGLRTIPFRGRLTICYSVLPAEVWIVGIFYAGQDVDSLLSDG